MGICHNGPRTPIQLGIHGAPLGRPRGGVEKRPPSPDPFLCSSLQPISSKRYLDSLFPYPHLQFSPAVVPIILFSHLFHQPRKPLLSGSPMTMCFLVSSLLYVISVLFLPHLLSSSHTDMFPFLVWTPLLISKHPHQLSH